MTRDLVPEYMIEAGLNEILEEARNKGKDLGTVTAKEIAHTREMCRRVILAAWMAYIQANSAEAESATCHPAEGARASARRASSPAPSGAAAPREEER